MKTRFTIALSMAGLFLMQLVFVSCNSSFEITKRRYNKGFFVDISSNTPSKAVHSEAARKVTNVSNENSVAVQESAPAEVLPSQQMTAAEMNTVTAATGTQIPVAKAKASEKQVVSAPVYASTSTVAKAAASMKETKAAVKQAVKHTRHAAGGGKSQIIAAILCFVVGGLGIHRFYLGYTWQGIVQLLTGGGCGIWALIDFVRILTGDLGPKNGNYDKTF